MRVAWNRNVRSEASSEIEWKDEMEACEGISGLVEPSRDRGRHDLFHVARVRVAAVKARVVREFRARYARLCGRRPSAGGGLLRVLT